MVIVAILFGVDKTAVLSCYIHLQIAITPVLLGNQPLAPNQSACALFGIYRIGWLPVSSKNYLVLMVGFEPTRCCHRYSSVRVYQFRHISLIPLPLYKYSKPIWCNQLC